MDNEYNNVLSYTEEQMLHLCNSSTHKIAERTKYSFIRPTNSIYVDFSYNDCLQANYIAFQNTDYSSKWFFAWIDEVIYKSDSACELKYTVDAWSTWFDKWNKKTCYIIREHVNDDTIGANLVPENLDVGEVIELAETEDISYSEYKWVAVLTSHNPLTNDNFPDPITVYNGNILPKKICLFEATDYSTLVNLGIFLLKTNHDDHTDDIDSIFFVPDSIINRSSLILNQGTVLQQNLEFYTLPNNFNIKSFNTSISKQYTYSDYTPKNNKLFTYPWNYLYVTNNIGNNNIYRYENFSTQNCVFKNEITMSVGCSGHIVPLNYKNMSRNDDEVIPLAKYPTLAWSSDTYTNWLTEQAVNIPTQLATSFIPGISLDKKSKKATFDVNPLKPAGEIANIIGGFFSASLMPQVSHGQNTADINFLSNRNTFTYKNMRCKKEFLQIADDYFSRFGYQINRVKQPNITGRRNWNYIEIASSEVIGTGTVPANFMSTINNACRKGVTIWHVHDNIGNYALNNDII